MTVCEYVLDQFTKYVNGSDEDKKRMGGLITRDDVESFEYFKVFCRNICEGGFVQDFEKMGITHEQLKKAVENKYMKRSDYCNWQALQTKRTIAYWLTNKGIKAIYDYSKRK